MEAVLKAWMDFLIAYAEDWDTRFRAEKQAHKLRYFTQEYWYLFTAVVKAESEGEPLTRQEALKAMRVPYDQDALLDRVKAAVGDGYIDEVKSPHDARKLLLLPTDKLRRTMNAHLSDTLALARNLVKKYPLDTGESP